MPVMRVQPLAWEGAVEKEMITQLQYSAWEVWWIEEPGQLQLMRSQSQT